VQFYIESERTYGQGSVSGLKPVFRSESDYRKIDLIVVYLANLINVIMSFLFVAQISALSQVAGVLGIVTMIMGFCLGYIAFINRRNKRDKWEAYLLIPIFLFFIVELVLDYILSFDFRSTALTGPYILFYYVGLWGLIGYAFRFDKKWGFLTLVTYFLNMSLSVLAHAAENRSQMIQCIVLIVGMESNRQPGQFKCQLLEP
jgi:small-conductance mechanosensitive channel